MVYSGENNLHQVAAWYNGLLQQELNSVLLQDADGALLSWSANTEELNITAKARQCRNVLQEKGA